MSLGSPANCIFVNKSVVMCNHRPLVAVFVVLENSSLVKSGRGQTKLSFGTSSFDVWCLIPEIISKQTPKSSEK